MGLLKKLFEELPDDVICALCNEVFLDPRVLQCNHMFCSACLVRRSARIKADICSTCETPYHGPSCRQADEGFKRKLLNLNAICNYKCGMKIKMAHLPEHLKDECQQAPVPCPNAIKGCKKKVKRCDLNKHIDECNFRVVTCEACGHVTIFQDLFTHQSRKKCLERKLKQQVIRELRHAHQEVINHRSNVKRDHIRLDIEQTKKVIQHARYLQERKQKLHQLLLSQNNNDAINSESGDSFFLTDLEELKNKNTSLSSTPVHSRSTVGSQQCDRCLKHFFPGKNHGKSCRWHEGVCINIDKECNYDRTSSTLVFVRKTNLTVQILPSDTMFRVVE